MTFSFRPAVRENVGLLIGLAGGTGSGKTFSAMRLAAGIAGEKRFAVIDTEAGRAKHYADRFKFDHGDLAPPFTPERYTEAIMAADKANYPVIVVDSASHEHAGDGGLLDMHEAELYRMAKDDWQRREACKMAAWVKPKGEHKAFVNKLLQVRAHLILCFRAEEKIEIVQEGGKWKAVPKKSRTGRDGWIPVCEKNLPFELTCSFLLLSDAPGFPNAIKLEEQHRALFPADKPINEETGRALAAWAAGGNQIGPTGRPIEGSTDHAKLATEPGNRGTAGPAELAPGDLASLLTEAELAAKGGINEYQRFWKQCKPAEQRALQKDHERLKEIARKSDESVGA